MFIVLYTMDRSVVYEIARQIERGASASDIYEAMAPVSINHSVVKKILASTQNHEDKDVIFVGCLLKAFSPKSLMFPSIRSTYGLCETIRVSLSLTRQQESSYRIKVAKELYQVDRVFKAKVDKIVEEVGNG